MHRTPDHPETIRTVEPSSNRRSYAESEGAVRISVPTPFEPSSNPVDEDGRYEDGTNAVRTVVEPATTPISDTKTARTNGTVRRYESNRGDMRGRRPKPTDDERDRCYISALTLDFPAISLGPGRKVAAGEAVWTRYVLQGDLEAIEDAQAALDRLGAEVEA